MHSARLALIELQRIQRGQLTGYARSTADQLCARATLKMHILDLVICRSATEDVLWAMQAFSRMGSDRGRVYVYNAGPSLNLLPQAGFEEVRVPTSSSPSFCYLEHIQTRLSHGNDFSTVTVFSPAEPECASGDCTYQLVLAIGALSSGSASLQPRGFAPIDLGQERTFWQGMPQHLMCLKEQYAQLSGGRDLHMDAEFTSFTPMGAFAAESKNLLSAPRGWLRRASEALRNASELTLLHTCCSHGKTCMPWLLDRLWPMLLATPEPNSQDSKRTGTGVRIGPTGRESVGAIKLRLDISRVSRVARFLNALSDDERQMIVNGLSGLERKASGDCDTQLCALQQLVVRARSRDGEPFGRYLTAAVNRSGKIALPERASRRCRQLFADASLFPGDVERIQVRFGGRSGGRIGADAATVKREGASLHSAVVKVYSACLDQMAADSRWFTRPFVYGFAREA